jgi:uncharacterized protein (TIGR02996 family)
MSVPRPQLLAFLDDVKEHADDDTPRLVLADWLEEQDNPADQARAEFLRVQCARAPLDLTDPRCRALNAREWALLRDHAAAWRTPLGLLQRECLFERGLVRALVGPGWLRQQAAALADSEAGAWVEGLRPPTLALRDFARFLPLLRPFRLTHLDLKWNHLGPAGARVLAEAPHLAHLTVLHLPKNGLGTGGAQALAGSPHLGRLGALDLRDNGLDADAAAALAQAPLPRLRRLDLGGNRLGDAGARALAFGLALPALTHLDLSDNGINREGAAALAVSPRLACLAVLDLRGNYLGDAGARALAELPHLAGLQCLTLSQGTVGNAGPLLQERFGARLHW